MTVGWRGIIAFEGVTTGDGRRIDLGALRWDRIPGSLRRASKDIGGHDNSEIVGRVDRVWRADNGEIWAEGPFDTGSDVGVEAARQVKEEFFTGVSVDLDDVVYEWRDSDGKPLQDNDGLIAVDDDVDMVQCTMSALLRAVTLVQIPAFKDARIEYVEDYRPAERPEEEAEDLVAAAAPVAPPKAWFMDPRLDGPTPLVVTEDGRVYGHLATWDTCHTANPSGKNICVTAPRSVTNYAHFHTGTLLTGEGDTISVGRLTMGTGHAGPSMTATATRAHYDNTGTAKADVRAGEDEFGIWVAGACRPNVDAAGRRALRSSPLSGDWRRVDGNLELFAALAVNVPGFPIPRPSGMVAAGRVTSLVATGMVAPRRVRAVAGDAQLSAGDVAYLRRLIMVNRQAERETLARRVRAADLRSRAVRMGVI